MEILSLGQKVKLYRKKMNLTLKELAGDRITAAQISHIERDKSYPSQDLLEYFAKKLGVTVEYLVESKEAQVKKICEVRLLEVETLIYNEEYHKAGKIVEWVIKLVEEHGIVDLEGLAKHSMGQIYIRLKNYKEAAHYLEESIRAYSSFGDHEGVIKSYLQLGLVYYHKNYFHSALDKYNQAELILKKNNIYNLELSYKTFFNISLCYVGLGQGNSALDYALKVKEVQEKMENHQDQGKTLTLLATGYMESGDLQAAKECLQQALSIYRKENEKKEIAFIENNLGHIYRKTGKYEEALHHLEKAYRLKKEIGDTTLPNTIFEYVQYYMEQKDYEKAEALIQEALSYAKGYQRELHRVDALRHLAQIQRRKQDYDKAIAAVEEGVEILQKMQLPKQLAASYLDLAELYGEVGEEKRSVAFYQKGIEIFKKTGVINM